MTETTHRLVPAPPPPRSRVHRLLAQLAPAWFAARVPGAESASLSAQANASPDVIPPAAERPSRSPWRLFAFTASAVVMAWAFRTYYGGPMLSKPVYAIGSLLWLAAAWLAHLRRRHHPPITDAPAGRRGPRLDYLLSWIGLLWASLAIL